MQFSISHCRLDGRSYFVSVSEQYTSGGIDATNLHAKT